MSRIDSDTEPREATISEDVNRRKAVEEELRIKEYAIHAAITGVAFGDLDGLITYANPAFVKMFGCEDESEVVGRPNAEFASDASIIEEIMAGVKSQGYWRGEDLARKKDGTPFPIEVAVAQMTDSDGNPLGQVATFIDLTSHKQAEEALRQSEERMRAVLGTASDAIITIDQRGIIAGVNPATEKMFGYSESELVGQNVKVLMPAPYHDEHDSYLERYQKTGNAHIIGIGREVAARRRDGSTFPIDLAVSEVSGLGLYTGIIRDISTRRNLEQEVYKASEKERIRIARDLHDSLGSLLTGIGYLASALSGKLHRGQPVAPGEVDIILDNIHDAIGQTRTLAQGLHRVSEDPDALPVALKDLAKRTRATLKLKCRFVAPSQDVTIGDSIAANHLFRIAQEAVTNAIRHSGATHLTIRLEKRKDDRLFLSIKDNGEGFDPSETRGTGLGLHTMAYRARAIGAELTIRPRKKKSGTAVICVWRSR